MAPRERFSTRELQSAEAARALFTRSFGHEPPSYPRHFGLFGGDLLVAYIHYLPFETAHLGGGLCVDERSYRRLSKEAWEDVKRQGGLATMLIRDTLGMLGESAAAFAHVGEPRSKQAQVRAGLVETGVPNLMVFWRRDLAEHEKARLVARVREHGRF